MKYFIFFFISLLIGCGRFTVKPVHEQQIPVEIESTVEVPFDSVLVIPEKTDTGTAVVLLGQDTTIYWHWNDASTQVDISPKNDSTRETTIFVQTTQKTKTIRIRDTLLVEVKVRDTVTIKPDCPDTIPPPPGKDAKPIDWIFWGVALLGAIVAGFLSRKKEKQK